MGCGESNKSTPLTDMSGVEPSSQLIDIDAIDLSKEELELIGQKIFMNECAAVIACLVEWNEGEAFPSLGIGHFIWYPTGVSEPFTESFPLLIKYMKAQSIILPKSLSTLKPFDAPWPTREHFLAIRGSQEIDELRHFLQSTMDAQIEYMLGRCINAFVKIINDVDVEQQTRIISILNAMLSTDGGIYPLIDYVNFKGEGLALSERYKGVGWGLKQVLLEMPNDALQGDQGDVLPRNIVAAFARSAKTVLKRRAENAPRSIEKDKWYPGWANRIDTYR